ncbi:hypothetical protein LCGC14_0945600 [marine sediment metagenome]|uniref:Glycine zipper domain-containing protein n=1 Tax=marine sediment metagenome TaxID=412755 RepID=A0A0F9RQ59_9ZZZZ
MGILDQDVRQFEATTGRRLPAFLKRRFSEAAIREKGRRTAEGRRLGILEKSVATGEERLAESKRQFDIGVGLTEEARIEQAKADEISGLVDIGTLAVSAKKSGILKGSPYVPPITLGTGVPPTGITTGAAESAVTGAVSPTATPGILESVSGAVAPLAQGFVAGKVGGFVGKALTGAGEEGHKGGERITGAAIGGTAGAATGALIGQALIPIPIVGAAIGTIIGGLFGAAEGSGGTHICTELHRQGLLSDELYDIDVQYAKTLDIEVVRGYQKWAKPVADKMAESKVLTNIVKSFAIPWAHHMAYKMDPENHKDNLFGKAVMKIGVPLCRINGRKIKWQVSYPESVNQER